MEIEVRQYSDETDICILGIGHKKPLFDENRSFCEMMYDHWKNIHIEDDTFITPHFELFQDETYKNETKVHDYIKQIKHKERTILLIANSALINGNLHKTWKYFDKLNYKRLFLDIYFLPLSFRFPVTLTEAFIGSYFDEYYNSYGSNENARKISEEQYEAMLDQISQMQRNGKWNTIKEIQAELKLRSMGGLYHYVKKRYNTTLSKYIND